MSDINNRRNNDWNQVTGGQPWQNPNYHYTGNPYDSRGYYPNQPTNMNQGYYPNGQHMPPYPQRPYVDPNDPRVRERNAVRELRKRVDHLSWGILTYNIITQILVILMTFGAAFFWMFTHWHASRNEYMDFVDRLDDSGLYMMIGLSFALGFLILYSFISKDASLKEIYSVKKKMSFEAFIKILCVFMMAQILFSCFDMVLEAIVSAIGLSTAASTEHATAGSETISMFIYSGFGAPFFEELVYRGFVGHNLRRYNKTFAIVVSALFFGIMHGNFVQIPFAFTVGIVLGYVALEYSIWYSMLLHFINNCVFGDLMVYLTDAMPSALGNFINQGTFICFGLAGVVILVLHRQDIFKYIDSHRVPKAMWKSLATSVPFWIFVALEFIAATMLLFS